MTFAWDLDGDGTADRTSGDSLVEIAYPTPGARTVTLTVTDGRGGTDAAGRSVTVTGRPAGEGPAGPTPPAALVPGPTLAEQAAAVSAAAAHAGFALTVPSFTIVSSRRERRIPSVIGMHVDRAREVLGAIHYVDLELNWTHRKPRGRGISLGDVMAQRPAAGTVTDSGVADLLGVTLDVYAGPKGRREEPCAEGFERAVRKR